MDTEKRNNLKKDIRELLGMCNELADENGIICGGVIEAMAVKLLSIRDIIAKTDGESCVTIPLVMDCVKCLDDYEPGKNELIKHKINRVGSSIETDTYFRYGQPKYYEYIAADMFENNVPSRKQYLKSNRCVNVLTNMYVKVYNACSFVFLNDKAVYEHRQIEEIPSQNMMPDKDRIVKLKKACCMANYWSINYWHLTFEIMSTIMELESVGYDGSYIVFDNVDARKIFELLKFDMDRIIWTNQSGITYHVEEMHVYQRGVSIPLLNDFAMKILDSINLSDLDRYPERIFVKRILSRRIKNEDDVLKVLNKYGFKTLIPEEVGLEEMIKHFRAAEIVFTPHGANSTNSIYMRPHTFFLECFGCTYINPCCIEILTIKKVHYFMLNEVVGTFDGKITDDFEVCVDLLESILSRIAF